DDRRQLAFTLSDQGLIRWRTGRWNDAVAALDEAVDTLNKLIADETDTSAAQKALAVVHARRGRGFEHLGRLAEAESEYLQAIESRRRVKDDMPTVFSYFAMPTPVWGRCAWGHSLAELAAFHLRHGQREHAARYFAQARDVVEDTAASF